MGQEDGVSLSLFSSLKKEFMSKEREWALYEQ
jgi:hypothetical protein